MGNRNEWENIKRVRTRGKRRKGGGRESSLGGRVSETFTSGFTLYYVQKEGHLSFLSVARMQPDHIVMIIVV